MALVGDAIVVVVFAGPLQKIEHVVHEVLEFVEATVASQLLSATAKATFDQSVQSYGSYLDLWRKYSEQEWQRSLRQAASVGVLAYSKAEEASDEGGVWRFHVVPTELQSFMGAWKALETDLRLELEATAIHPDWTTNIADATQTVASASRFRGRPELLRNKSAKLGFDPERSPVSSDSPGEMWVTLPADMLDLLAKARAAGIEDRETVDSGVNVALRKAGLPTLPGLFEVNIEGATDDAASTSNAG